MDKSSYGHDSDTTFEADLKHLQQFLRQAQGSERMQCCREDAGLFEQAPRNQDYVPVLMLEVSTRSDLTEDQIWKLKPQNRTSVAKLEAVHRYNGSSSVPQTRAEYCIEVVQVAKLYVEGKARGSELQSLKREGKRPNLSTEGLADVGGDGMRLAEPDALQWQAQEFNPYLNALGFMPGLEFAELPFSHFPYSNNSADAPNNLTWSSDSMDYSSTVGIQDWFSGNQSIMGLLTGFGFRSMVGLRDRNMYIHISIKLTCSFRADITYLCRMLV